MKFKCNIFGHKGYLDDIEIVFEGRSVCTHGSNDKHLVDQFNECAHQEVFIL